MKIKDTKNLLKEKVEDVLDDMLEEMEEPTSEKEPKEVTAPEGAVKKELDADHVETEKEVKSVEGKENEEAPRSVVSGVEGDVKDDHAAEGEEVSEVVVKEESVEKSLEDDHIGEDSELEPVEGKENEEAEHKDEKAVDADLEAEHVGEGEELEPVEGKENEEAPAADKKEVEAVLDADHAEEKKDVEGVVVKEEDLELAEDTLETDPAAEEAKEEYGEVAKSADVGDAGKEEDKAEETVEKVDELLKDEPVSEPEKGEEEDKLLEDNMKSIFDLINTINESLMPEATEDKEPKEACPVEAAKEVEAKAEEEEAAKGEEVKEVIVKEDEAAKVGEPEKKEFDVDAVIKTPEVAEMGTEESEEHIENVEDGKCPCGEHKEGECECKPEAKALKESMSYTSLKEACMLDEGYFTTDTYLVESAEAKQQRLVEQVAVLMAREGNDPLYEELIAAAIRLDRLQEAVVNKYYDAAAEKAGVIMEGIFNRGSGNIKIGKGAVIKGAVGNGNNSGDSKGTNGDIKNDGKGNIKLGDKIQVDGSVGNGNNSGDSKGGSNADIKNAGAGNISLGAEAKIKDHIGNGNNTGNSGK